MKTPTFEEVREEYLQFCISQNCCADCKYYRGTDRREKNCFAEYTYNVMRDNRNNEA